MKIMENFPTYGSKYMREEIFDMRCNEKKRKNVVIAGVSFTQSNLNLNKRVYFKENFI